MTSTPPPPDFAQRLVDRIERLMTSSAAVLRAKVYDELGAAGVDVPKLVIDARAVVLAEAKDRAERSSRTWRMLQQRVRDGRLPPEKLAEAKERLAKAPATVKAHKEVLKRIEARPLPQSPSAPTRELVRQMGRTPVVQDREPDGSPLSAPRHVFEWPVDRVSVAMTGEEYGAAVRLREAYLRRQNTPGAVDWNRSGGSVPGSRLPIRDEQLKASYEWNAVWHRLDPTLRLIVRNFLLEEPPPGHSAPLDGVEFGKVYGATKDPNRARGVTIGAVRTACAQISRLFQEYDHWRADKAREQRRQGRP
tara:strand:- start:9708 stop:10625 length:918 start_codon:yes stop_codon:yes gene_type:complete